MIVFLPTFISHKIQPPLDDTMVTMKVDADATVRGSDDQEQHPIVAKVKGTGVDGALSVQVSGQQSSAISARISGDEKNPIALGPLEVAPITVIPDLSQAAKSMDFAALIGALTKLSQGVKVDIGNSSAPLAVAPLSVALGKIPVDLTISVSTPTSESVFKVEIKGTVGE
ncbi:MAG: hypothetical protein LUQ30_03540 [Methanothrix sp.]|nr:hypothetical protein [Methanothrix sp.]